MLGWFYGRIANLRNALYEKGVFKSFLLGVPTVSIGNITVGGTGKTPLVAFVAEVLAEKGEKVCILTRGYGRENPKQRILVSDGENILVDVKTSGDEPFELSQKLLGKAIVVADANRAAAARWARKKFGVTVFVLDDGFQHRRVRRDLDIVCVDAMKPFGNGKVLPSGILREPLQNLKRADAFVITRANLVENTENLKSQISNLNIDCPVFIAENKISNLIELEKFNAKEQRTTEYQLLTTDRFFAFCALGNPDNFFNQLRHENYNLVATEIFPDHHHYKSNDAARLTRLARQSRADYLLTTAKDAVKLKNLKFDFPCYVVESKMIFDDEKKLRDVIHAVFNLKSKI